MKTICFFFTLLCTTLSFSQNEVITLKTKTIIDGNGNVITNKNILVKEGHIIEISNREAGKVYDLTQMTVLPGGIDTHNHLDWHFDEDGKFHDATLEEESMAERTLKAAENAYLTLKAGITTVQSLGSEIDLDVRNAINRGVLPGPHVLTSAVAVNARTGDAEAIKALVNSNADRGVDVIKIFASTGVTSGGVPTLTQEQMNAACGQAKARGLRAVVHAAGPESVKRAIKAGCTTIEHGTFLDKETLELMTKSGTFLDPHIGLVMQNYVDHKEKYVGVGGFTEETIQKLGDVIPQAIAAFKLANETEGLKIVFGTDAVAGAHGKNFEELILRVTTGNQDTMKALVSAGALAAESLGFDDRGVIAVGKRADIIAVQGNPIEDITTMRNVNFVMKDGKVYVNTISN